MLILSSKLSLSRDRCQVGLPHFCRFDWEGDSDSKWIERIYYIYSINKVSVVSAFHTPKRARTRVRQVRYLGHKV